MRNRNDYEKAIEVTGAVIRGWDPYCLIEEGAPSDEFDAEIEKLVTYIPHIRSAADAAQAISEVLSTAFETERFSAAQCTEPGEKLFASLVTAGLVSRP
jgi:hypothetical protein